ncbi:MAG TPA: hypothetical protein PLD90_11420 [Rhodocyclaceae bacterium]|nr:hypothetical protein [Rhodocyclaceae bacterium]HND23149.1 hypothetical protein [Rhodocyclaceae bacterium]
MALLRCNQCGHVAEPAADTVGQHLPCPHCGTSVPVYDTVLFVRKVLQQYFALRDENTRLKDALAAAPATTEEAPAAPASAPPLSDIDLHNSSHFASEAQHAAIQQWFARRQIEARPNRDAVDTTGFYDEIAVALGDHYELYRDVLDKIRWGHKKDIPQFSLNLTERSQKDGQALNAFCRQLHDSAFLSKYFYQKQDKIIRASVQTAPAIRAFFAGEWLEWYALMKLLAFFRDRGLGFSCTRNLHITFANEDLHELDVFFLLDDGTPVCVECKTGEFRADIDKMLRLRKRLGIDRSQFIVCALGLGDEQAAGLSGTYELSFVTPAGLLPHLARLF